MFETFNVPCFYLSMQSILALYASGRTTGVVIDSGHGITHTVPVVEGYAHPMAISKIKVAGKEVSQFLQDLLKKRKINVETKHMSELKKLCYVSADFELEAEDLTPDFASKYKLPDGNEIALQNERFTAPELMFQPSLGGLRLNGVHQYCFNSINRCKEESRKELYNNVLLCGGNTMFKGISERVFTELHQLAPSCMKIKILASPER